MNHPCRHEEEGQLENELAPDHRREPDVVPRSQPSHQNVPEEVTVPRNEVPQRAGVELGKRGLPIDEDRSSDVGNEESKEGNPWGPS
jgi:hypothetical protein